MSHPQDPEPDFNEEEFKRLIKQNKKVININSKLTEENNDLKLKHDELEVMLKEAHQKIKELESNQSMKTSTSNKILNAIKPFIDQKKSGRKAYYNPQMRNKFNSFCYKEWDSYIKGLVDGDDKQWDLDKMVNYMDDQVGMKMGKEFFNYTFDKFEAMIDAGEISVDLSDSGSPASSATSSPAHVSPPTTFTFGAGTKTSKKK